MLPPAAAFLAPFLGCRSLRHVGRRVNESKGLCKENVSGIPPFVRQISPPVTADRQHETQDIQKEIEDIEVKA